MSTEEIEENITASSDYLENSTTDIKKLLLGDNYSAPNLHSEQREFYNAVLASFFKLNNERSGYYEELDKFRNNYLVQLMLDVLIDDVLTEGSVGVIIDISSEDKKYDEILKEFSKKFDIPGLIEDILFDLLLYGEYSLETKTKEHEGITEINDNVLPGSLIALYESRFPKFFWVGTKKTGFKIHPVKDYVHFCLYSRKVRVSIENERVESSVNLDPTRKRRKLKKDIFSAPIFRVGRSLIWSSLEKLKELSLMEKAFTANLFSLLTSTNLISLNLPSSMPIKEVMEVTKNYEEMLNSADNKMKLSTGDESQALTDLIRESTRIKVVPSFSEKGGLDKLDLNSSSKIDVLPNINDAREVVAQSVGIPPELLFGEVGNRRAALKQYARYARRVKAIQRSLVLGVKQLCLNHLAHHTMSTDISLDDIQVDMRSNINIDEIDNLEGVELVLSSIQELTTLVEGMNDSSLDLSEYIDKEEYVKYIKSTLKSIGFKAFNIIKTDKIKE